MHLQLRACRRTRRRTGPAYLRPATPRHKNCRCFFFWGVLNFKHVFRYPRGIYVAVSESQLKIFAPAWVVDKQIIIEAMMYAVHYIFT